MSSFSSKAPQERDLLERDVRVPSEQAAAASAIVDEAVDAGPGYPAPSPSHFTRAWKKLAVATPSLLETEKRLVRDLSVADWSALANLLRRVAPPAKEG